MKKSAELLGLNVFSIEEGKELGHIIDLIINPDQGIVEFLVVSNGVKYIGEKVLPFKDIEGVGEHAVTINNQMLIVEFKDVAGINDLLVKDVQIKGTRVITQKGKILGNVSEFLVDEEEEGKITGCILLPSDSTLNTGVIPSDVVVTFGKDVLVVKQDTLEHIQDFKENGEEEKKNKQNNVVEEKNEPVKIEPIKEQIATEIQETDTIKEIENQNIEEPKEENLQAQQDYEPAKIFEDRQRQYLLGKKANKKIQTDNGEIIVEEGNQITEDMIEKASKTGKLLELIMNVKS